MDQVEGTEFISNKISIDQDGTSIRIDNATFTSGFFNIALRVQYTRFEVTPFEVPAMSSYGPLYIGLSLSLDNTSWNRIITEVYSNNDIWMNGSDEFIIENSLFSPFPFDVEKDDTLFVCIERGLEGYRVNRTPTIALQCPFDITRPWYFVIDWTLPSIFGLLFFGMFAFQRIVRYYSRRQSEHQKRPTVTKA